MLKRPNRNSEEYIYAAIAKNKNMENKTSHLKPGIGGVQQE